jgi:hypothetical protein
MPKDLSADDRPSLSFGRMHPKLPEGPAREPTPQGHRNGLCNTCGAEIGRLCRCRKTGRFMSGVHDSRKVRTERTGGAYLTRAEMRKIKKGK